MNSATSLEVYNVIWALPFIIVIIVIMINYCIYIFLLSFYPTGLLVSLFMGFLSLWTHVCFLCLLFDSTLFLLFICSVRFRCVGFCFIYFIILVYIIIPQKPICFPIRDRKGIDTDRRGGKENVEVYKERNLQSWYIIQGKVHFQ